MSRDDAALADVLIAARRILQFTRGLDHDAFLRDVEKQSAVLHQLLVLGEAARRLSPTAWARHGSIPWRKVVAMRNVLIHAYDQVDLEIVWATIEQELPSLVASLEAFHLSPPTEG